MAGSYFDYSEVLKYAKKLGIAEKEFKNWLKEFLLLQAQRVVAEAKKRQRAVGAIDTGFMINSWTIGDESISLKANSKGKYSVIDSGFSRQADITDIKVTGNRFEVTIKNTAEYASFIEFGQRSYTGKYILTISIDTVQRALPSRFKTEWNKFLKDRGLI